MRERARNYTGLPGRGKTLRTAEAEAEAIPSNSITRKGNIVSLSLIEKRPACSVVVRFRTRVSRAVTRGTAVVRSEKQIALDSGRGLASSCCSSEDTWITQWLIIS